MLFGTTEGKDVTLLHNGLRDQRLNKDKIVLFGGRSTLWSKTC